MRTINRRIASAYIVSADGKVLFGRKDPAKGGVYLDCWHTPGGGIDDGETDTQAMCREILEETGIVIDELQLELVDNLGTGESTKRLDSGEEALVKMQFNIFKAALSELAANVTIMASDDLINFTWFDLDAISDIKLTPPGQALLSRIGTEWLRGQDKLRNAG